MTTMYAETTAEMVIEESLDAQPESTLVNASPNAEHVQWTFSAKNPNHVSGLVGDEAAEPVTPITM